MARRIISLNWNLYSILPAMIKTISRTGQMRVAKDKRLIEWLTTAKTRNGEKWVAQRTTDTHKMHIYTYIHIYTHTQAQLANRQRWLHINIYTCRYVDFAENQRWRLKFNSVYLLIFLYFPFIVIILLFLFHSI